MTDFKINRRNLMAAAGIGALAACKGAPCKDSKAPPASMVGWDPPFGLNPNYPDWNTLDQAHNGKLPAFKPDFLTFIRISGRTNWKFDINHASFDVGGYTPQARESLADRVITLLSAMPAGRLKNLKNVPGFTGRFYERNHPPVPSPGPKEIDVLGFDYLGSNAPTEVYIWLDIPGAELLPKQYIAFTSLSHEGLPTVDVPWFPDPNYRQQRVSPNDSFFARKVRFGSREIIQIRNYFCDYDQQTGDFKPRKGLNPPSPPRVYSMNIHFSLAGQGNQRIPMVIDPSTGSGAGWEP